MLFTFIMTFGLSRTRPACYLGFVEHRDAYAVTPTELHDYVDWRANMSHIKDQGDCGSCYAESAVGTFEAAWSLRTGRVHNFSVQQSIDCSSKQGNQGCGGGWMHAVYQWIISGDGILLDAQDPYVAMDHNCSNKSGSEIAYLKSWSYVHPSQLALLHWITKQPISIAVDANDCWDSYSGGVINATNCPSALDPPELDHGVIAVGYDLRGPQPYYIVRNSWGLSWGEGGYVKIALNLSHSGGLFGLATQPTVPIV
jgi:C1A family cysteine protease